MSSVNPFCALSIYPILKNEGNSINCETNSINMYSDSPVEEWNKTFGGNKFDNFFGVKQTADEGFVCIGVKDADWFTEGGMCWLVKTNKYGDLLWERTFGGDGADSGHDVQITSDGGYIIGGVTTSFGSGNRDAWIIKTNNNGYEEWNCTFNRKTSDMVYVSIMATSESGYIICCDAYSDVSKDQDAWVVKIDENGHQQWNSTYGFGNGREFFSSVKSTRDGGYVFTGSTHNQITGRYDAWVVKTDADGQVQWDKKFGPAYTGRDIIQTSEGGYLLIATAMVNGEMDNLASWLIKLNENGNEEWDKLFDRPDGKNFSYHNKIIQMSDENYLLFGTLGEFPLHYIADMWLVKIDRNGNILWELTYGGPDFDAMDDGEQTLDGGLIVAGGITNDNSVDWDAQLVKISSDQDGNQPPNKPGINGPISGRINQECSYITSTTDSNEDQLNYWFDWDDGTDSGWFGPYNSGATCNVTHIWTVQGKYEIRVKARDILGAESEWSDPLPITMPKTYCIYGFIDWFIYRFPFLNLILKYLVI